jgi:hypothetical protein
LRGTAAAVWLGFSACGGSTGFFQSGDAAIDTTTGDSLTTQFTDSGVDSPVDSGVDSATDTADTWVTDTWVTDTNVTDTSHSDTPLDSAKDSATDAIVDSTTDAPADTDAGCTPGTACASPPGAICLANATCGQCSGSNPTGDAQCLTAYGTGVYCLTAATGQNWCTSAACRTNSECSNGAICSASFQCVPCTTNLQCAGYDGTTNPFVCANGACTPGNCVLSKDCTAIGDTGEVCVSNNCTACSSDSQCANDTYYAPLGDTFCDSNSKGATHGQCIPPGACSSTTATSCADGSHLCCGTTCLSGVSYSSQTGEGASCCSAADCGDAGYTCNLATHLCNQCALAGSDYFVDPVNGNDVTGTGSGTGSNPGGCALKTVTKALQLIAAAGAGSFTVHVLGNIGAVNAETFPLVVPAKAIVTITSDSKPFTVAGTSAASDLFDTTGTVKINNLALGGTFNYGISATSGALTVTNVSIAFADSTAGRALNIANASATLSGLSIANGLYGIYESGGATVNLAGTSSITGSRVGVYVTGTSGLNVTGTPGASPYTNATVSIANTNDGLVVNQTPASVNQLVSINGLVVLNSTTFNNANGYNIVVYGGSNFTMRNSVTLGAAQSGIIVTPNTAAGFTGDQLNDISNIDLGDTTTAGHNVLQAVTANGISYNLGVGLCVATRHVSSAILSAVGDSFVTASTAPVNVDCSTSSQVVTGAGSCAPRGTARSVAYSNAAGGATTVVDRANVSSCL